VLEPNKGRLEGIESIGAAFAWVKDDDGTLSDKDIRKRCTIEQEK
jgi:hypothetical protein